MGSKGADGGPTSVKGVGTTAEGTRHVTFSVPQLEQAHACETEVSGGGSASVNRVDTPEEEDLPKDLNPSWVECVKDKRSWAELLEDQTISTDADDPAPSPVCVHAIGGGAGRITHTHRCHVIGAGGGASPGTGGEAEKLKKIIEEKEVS